MMPTFDILVADELLPQVTNGNPLLPQGWHVHDERPQQPRGGFAVCATLLRVTDNHAPDWTDGQLIHCTISAELAPDGTVRRTWVSEYRAVEQGEIISGMLTGGQGDDAMTKDPADPALDRLAVWPERHVLQPSRLHGI